MSNTVNFAEQANLKVGPIIPKMMANVNYVRIPVNIMS
jgi:hypothetical protein